MQRVLVAPLIDFALHLFCCHLPVGMSSFRRYLPFIAIAVGIAVGAIWGVLYDAQTAGWLLGVLLGIGAGLMLSRKRSVEKFFHLPPWQGILGTVLVSIAIGCIANSTLTVYGSRYLGLDRWQPDHATIGAGNGFVLYTDMRVEPDDSDLVQFINDFRRAISIQLFPLPNQRCEAEVHFVRDRATYEGIARRFRANTQFGFYLPRWIGRPLIVIRGDSGMGTITHEMMHHYMRCTFQKVLPLWIEEGMATITEKFVALQEDDGHLNFSWGYRSPWRQKEIDETLNSVVLASVLRQGKPQSVLQSFFLFLRDRGQIDPLLQQLRIQEKNGMQTLEVITQETVADLEQQWRNWLDQQSGTIPMAITSFAAWDKDAPRARNYLDANFAWNAELGIWMARDRSHNVIPPLEFILSGRSFPTNSENLPW